MTERMDEKYGQAMADPPNSCEEIICREWLGGVLKYCEPTPLDVAISSHCSLLNSDFRSSVSGIAHRCHILETTGESYRLKDARSRRRKKT